MSEPLEKSEVYRSYPDDYTGALGHLEDKLNAAIDWINELEARYEMHTQGTGQMYKVPADNIIKTDENYKVHEDTSHPVQVHPVSPCQRT